MEKKVYSLELARGEVHAILAALVEHESFCRSTACGNLDSQFGCNDYDKAKAFIDAAQTSHDLHERLCYVFGVKSR